MEQSVVIRIFFNRHIVITLEVDYINKRNIYSNSVVFAFARITTQ